MKFNIWTFLFQVLNFFVLLYILRRLLFRPVREIMEKRRELIAGTIESAEKTKQEAEELKKANLAELESIRNERLRIIEEMRADMSAERKRLIESAEEEAQKIVQKEKAIIEAETKRAQAGIREAAIGAVSVYALSLLRDLADDTVHEAIAGRMMADIGRICSGIMERTSGDKAVAVEISSARPLPEGYIDDIRKGIEAGTGKTVEISTDIDPDLVAGFVLKAYDMVYDLSVSGQVRTLTARLKENI